MAKGLPSGTVTFVFTDIEGSTRLVRDLGDAYSDLLDQHHRLLREVWTRHRGVEVLTEGDAFFVAFASAADALAATVDGQRALTAATWPIDSPLRVRMGLHVGYAKPVDDDYRALAVHQAARVVDAANGGQILATADVVELRGDAPVDITNLGHYRVRDFDEPIELFQVTATDLEFDDRPPRVRPADSHNLVRPGTSLINRSIELLELAAATTPGALVTILGPGGAGKTRLSIEIGLDVVDEWPDGVWFVDLAPLTAGEVVPMAIADAIGARSVPGNDALTDVLAHLEERTMLMILDNCEHIVDSISVLVGQLLAAAPGLGVLATSRIPLGLIGESVHRLDPLDTADTEADAVRLFLDRSNLGDQVDLEAVVGLCRAVDGLPLAIELAATRAHLLTPAEMTERMRSSVAVVSTRDPTLPDRQRSLDRLLDWSLDLLGPDELLVLRRLAVVADGFDVTLAESVAGDERVPVNRVPELVWTLIDASLVQREVAAGTSRYRLLGTVRSYVLESADAADMAAARQRLADALIDALGPLRPASQRWVTAMGIELENLRAVVDDPTVEDRIARSLAWSIAQYHDVTSSYRSGIAEIARCIQHRSAPGSELVALLSMQADLHLRLGEVDEAAAIVERAVALAEEVGRPVWDDTGLARTQGEIALRRDDPVEAIRIAEAALAIGPATPRGEARIWNLMAIARYTIDDRVGMSEALDACLRADEAAGLESFLATTHGNYAEALLSLGDPAGGARHQLKALELARSLGQATLIAFSHMVAARFALEAGDADDAVRLQAAADAILAREGVQLYAADEEQRTSLLESAASVLGTEGFASATAAGASSAPEQIADLTETILRRRATTPLTTGG
jgi:predicted ATPase/class 3 adenylate cyclase